MTSSGGHILKVSDLSVSYGDAQVLREVSLEVAGSSVTGLAGESGSGKSSLLKAVAGLLDGNARITGGSIELDGRVTACAGAGGTRSGRAERPFRRQAGQAPSVSYIFQDPAQSLDPLFKLRSQFDECLVAAQRGRAGRKEREAAMLAALETLGFDEPQHVLNARPYELSGGMCQRVVLAMGVARGARLFLADEPTSALDPVSQQQVMNELLRLKNELGAGVVIVSHDLAVLASVADFIGVMHEGRIVEFSEGPELIKKPCSPYAQKLIAAVPRFRRHGASATKEAALGKEDSHAS